MRTHPGQAARERTEAHGFHAPGTLRSHGLRMLKRLYNTCCSRTQPAAACLGGRRCSAGPCMDLPSILDCDAMLLAKMHSACCKMPAASALLSRFRSSQRTRVHARLAPFTLTQRAGQAHQRRPHADAADADARRERHHELAGASRPSNCVQLVPHGAPVAHTKSASSFCNDMLQ